MALRVGKASAKLVENNRADCGCMRKTSKWLGFIGLILTILILLTAPLSFALAANIRLSFAGSRRLKRTTISKNWSGYVAESSVNSPTNGFVTSVKGSWTVPTLKPDSPSDSYVAIWVGIDGFSDGTVEQIGTDSEWFYGVQQDYAWVELYPNPSQVISSITVNAGDQINASVIYKGNNYYVFSLADLTTGQFYSHTLKANAQRQSAEWIVEAPSSSSGILPLADFGLDYFSYAQFADSTGTVYAVNGRGTGTYDAIIINDPQGGVAAPSVLTDARYPQGPSSFSVTYGAMQVTQLSYPTRRGGSPWTLFV